MGRCLKNVEEPLVLGLHLGVTFKDQASGLGFGSRFNFGYRFLVWVLGLGFGCWV